MIELLAIFAAFIGAVMPIKHLEGEYLLPVRIERRARTGTELSNPLLLRFENIEISNPAKDVEMFATFFDLVPVLSLECPIPWNAWPHKSLRIWSGTAGNNKLFFGRKLEVRRQWMIQKSGVCEYAHTDWNRWSSILYKCAKPVTIAEVSRPKKCIDNNSSSRLMHHGFAGYLIGIHHGFGGLHRFGSNIFGRFSITLSNSQGPLLIFRRFTGFSPRPAFKSEIQAIAAPSFPQSTVRLPNGNDKPHNGRQAQHNSDDRRYRCNSSFFRCFFSSDGGPPLSAQVGSVVILSVIAGIGIAVGIGPVGRLRRLGWRGGRLGRGLCLLGSACSLGLFGWLLSSSYS